ncbi:MAG TPA: ATP-binding cassette domain-containing protein [Myxococcales bacterium]
MLEFRVRKRVGPLDLDVALAASAETMLIAGPNGAGKSTLLRLLLGVLRPDAGRIALEGSALFDSAARVDAPPERRRLGYVPQDYALFPHLDVAGNVAFGLANLPRPERRERVAQWLGRLDLVPLARRSVAALSGGERQRVALARALAREPRALLLDEPFASLDPGARRDLRASLRGWLREWRLPALMVSHDPADAAAADRIAVLERGRLVQQGTLDELRASPATEFVAAFQAVGA